MEVGELLALVVGRDVVLEDEGAVAPAAKPDPVGVRVRSVRLVQEPELREILVPIRSRHPERILDRVPGGECAALRAERLAEELKRPRPAVGGEHRVVAGLDRATGSF